MKELDFFSAVSPLQEVFLPEISKARLQLFVKREDLLHPGISGNKWRKLKYNIVELKNLEKEGIITFGGAYSNHLHAVAAAGEQFGFTTIGIVRGEQPTVLSSTLKSCIDLGMKLYFVPREEYKIKEQSKEISEIKNSHPNFLFIPEGGENELSKKGCEEILREIQIDANYICVPCGTGTTVAGILNSEILNSQIIGFPALKGAEESMIKTIESSLRIRSRKDAYQVISDYHFGGYAKHNEELLNFIRNFEKATNIPLEQVYTGKMMYGIVDLAKKKFFEANSKIVAIHTGGLQGRLPELST